MKCDKCGKCSSSLTRQNQKGVKGIFWCKPCITGEPEERKGEPMTHLRQLERWVGGESVHNRTRDECCPDFSCCGQEPWPKNKRKEFAEAFVEEDEEKILSMLMGALGGLVKKEFPDENIRIAGDD